MPVAMLAYIPKFAGLQFSPDLPHSVLPLLPTKVYGGMQLGRAIKPTDKERRAVTSITFIRLGFNILYIHGVTSYFSQGKTFKCKLGIDLRIPRGLGPTNLKTLRQHFIVMLSRAIKDSDWFLLAPLYRKGNAVEKQKVLAQFRELFQPDRDLLTEIQEHKTHYVTSKNIIVNLLTNKYPDLYEFYQTLQYRQ